MSSTPHDGDESKTVWPWISDGMQELRQLDSQLLRGTELGFSNDHLAKNITALRELTAQFSKRLNRLQSAVHSLPADLLHEVFTLVAQEEPANTVDLGWVRLGHVCSRFREVLLDCHTLWADNVSTLPKASQDFLERAGETPITIDLDTDDEDILYFALFNMVQARRLTIRHEEACITVRDTFIGSHLPLLERLCVDACPHLAAEGPRPAAHELPDHSLGSSSSTAEPLEAPNLRHLHLRGIYVPFTPESLVHLKLEHILAEVFNRSAEPLLVLIERCILLQGLHLCWALPSAPSQTTSRGTPRMIHLPHLKTLFIEDEELRSEALWSILSIPPTASVTFIPQCPPTVSGGMEISAARIIPAFVAHVRDSNPVGLRLIFRGTGNSRSETANASLSVSVTSRKDATHSWTPWKERGHMGQLSEGSSLNLIFKRKQQWAFHFSSFLGSGNTVLSGIRDPSSIVSLEISFAAPTVANMLEETAENRQEWGPFLSAFPGLESFTLDGPCMSPLCAMQPQVGGTIVPRLQRLCIARTIVVRGDRGYARFGIRVDELIETARLRAAAGSPLRLLSLPNVIEMPADDSHILGELQNALKAPDWPGVPPILEYEILPRNM